MLQTYKIHQYPRVDRTKDRLMGDIIFNIGSDVTERMAEEQSQLSFVGQRHGIALTLIKQEQSKKRSVKGKRLDAGWNNDY